MTVSSTVRKFGPYEGNGSGTTFSFSPAVIYASTDLVVTRTDVDDVETVLAEGSGSSNYSVTVAAYPGTGSITYPATGTPLAAGNFITITPRLPLTQAVDLSSSGYTPETHETALDKVVHIAQQLQEQLTRAIKVPVSSTQTADALRDELLSVAGYTAADAAAAAASASAAATSASGAATSASAASTSASAASTSASSASTSAASAATAETNAETAETNAETAQATAEAAVADAIALYGGASALSDAVTAAETAETNAETAETNAETAQTAAASSASAAATSASNAATSASTASTQASNASTSASAAATSASGAATSASSASTSATAAQTAETNAETAETNAAASASAASTSASAASTSASSAATSATAAQTAETNAETAQAAAEASAEAAAGFELVLQTTDDTPTNFPTGIVLDNETVAIDGFVIARGAFTDGVGNVRPGAVFSILLVADLANGLDGNLRVETITELWNELAVPAPAASYSAGTVNVQVTGISTRTIDWKLSVRIPSVASA